MKLVDCKILSISRFGTEEGYQPTNALFYVLGGSFSLSLDGKETVISENELVSFPKNMYFRRRVLAPLTFYYLKVDCEDSLMPRGHVPIENHARILSTLSYLLAIAAEAKADAAEASHYTRDVFMQIERERKQGRTVRDGVVLRAERYFEGHLSEKLSLGKLSAALGISPAGLISHFKAARGVTPIRRLTEMRIQRAESLLLSLDKTLAEIAAQVGFDNAFYFSNVFKKEKGLSPSAYRKKHGV